MGSNDYGFYLMRYIESYDALKYSVVDNMNKYVL
jgi:hypothetical protein